MSKKKKKKNAPNAAQEKPVTSENGNPENIITIEIPDNPEAEQISPENKTESADLKQPEPQKSKDKAPKAARTEEAPIPEKAKAAVSAIPQQPDEPENPDNEITLELPDSEAEKISKFVPSVNSAQKPPLTPEQLAAKKRRIRTAVSKSADVVLFVIMTIAGLLMVLPIFFVLVQSLKSTAGLSEIPQTFFPKSLTFNSFVELFISTGEVGVPFYRFIFNTLFVAAAVTVLRIAVTVPAAYVLAKVKAPMIKTLNRLVELSLALSPALAFVMNYVFLAKTGLADTYLAVILPFITSPLCLVLIREAIRRIPDDTIMAARLEGASHAMILRKFVSPQIKPAIVATAILSLLEMGRLSGRVLTFGETLDTLPAFMEQLGERGAAGEMYALAVLMLIPAAALFIIFRKSILGLMTTAMLKDED